MPKAATSGSGDVFGFVDRVRSAAPETSSREDPRRLLLASVAARLATAEIPVVESETPWMIDTNALAVGDLLDAVRIRAGLAADFGVDLRPRFAINEKALRSFASHLAHLLYELRVREPSQVVRSIPGYEGLLEHIGLPPVGAKHVARWFGQALLRHERQLADYFAHCLQDIGADQSRIVSPVVLASRARQRQLQFEFAASHRMVSAGDDGQVISLPFADAANNAKRRFSKIYVRLVGLEKYCTGLGLVGLFVTCTLSGKFHPNPTKGRATWDGSTPRQGHDEMQSRWRRLQRRFGEGGDKLLGVRVEEPHVDGCIHWHMVVYVSAERESELRQRISAIFGTGAAAKVERINRELGTGASYLMKYIQPSHIDSGTLASECSRESEEHKDTSLRYDAHRATWGGRAIQFFDVKGSATLWDEMRRIKVESSEFAELGPRGRDLHSAATGNDYCRFLEVLTEVRRHGPSRIRVMYGERESGSKSLLGVEIDGQCIETHKQIWRCVRVSDRNIAK